MSEARFEIILDPDAAKEYKKLDNSVLEIVDNAIDRLEERADEIGKVLHNYQGTKLAGCKEIKLKDAGVCIIFKVTDYVVNILQVVYVLTIEHRAKYKVFKVATGRRFHIHQFAGLCEGSRGAKALVNGLRTGFFQARTPRCGTTYQNVVEFCAGSAGLAVVAGLRSGLQGSPCYEA